MAELHESLTHSFRVNYYHLSFVELAEFLARQFPACKPKLEARDTGRFIVCAHPRRTRCEAVGWVLDQNVRIESQGRRNWHDRHERATTRADYSDDIKALSEKIRATVERNAL